MRSKVLIAALLGFTLFGAVPSNASSLTLVTTGSNSANEWPIYIGRKKNFFTEAGVSFSTVSASSTAAAIQQIAAGSGEMASGGLTDPVRAIDNGAAVSIIRIHAQVPPYTIWAKPGIKTINDLRNKVVILGGAKDITRIYFDRMALPNGLKKGDYDMVFAGTTPSRFAALQAGAVDAAILLPPFSFRAESAGFSLVGRLSDYVKDLPFTGYAVNTRWAKANRATVVNFFKGYQRAVDWFRDPTNRDEAIEILISEAKINRADAIASYDYMTSIDIFSAKGIVTPEALTTLVRALADDGDLRGSANPSRFIDPEIVAMNVEASR
jgi:NitT/TauT family transport system substrate-binding protein